MRISQKWWICLKRKGEDTFDVEIVGYHWEMIMMTAFPALIGKVLKEDFPDAMKSTEQKVTV